ncbi:MAG: nuclear transport factor 2 family protein [Acidobacteria bacterium]|nr:nuclear transport factor 2 family protein [Acidobacteriota bacterium]
MERQASELHEALMSLSEELAAAISARDADRATRGVREDEHVVYVSDGAVIRGREYREMLRQLYARMQQIDFRWERREVEPVGENAGVVIGWAAIALLDNGGVSSTNKALFTLVYRETGGSWELLSAHKTTVP